MTIAEKLIYLQKFYKLSDSKFSRIAGVSKDTLNSWKCGSVKPSETSLKKLCDHFSLVPYYFIQDDLILKPLSKIESYEIILDENVYEARLKSTKESSKAATNCVDEVTPNEDNARYEEAD